MTALEPAPLKPGIYAHYFKRPLDFICALLAIIILLPCFLIIFIAIRINLGSPVFFKQQRPGKNGKIFNLIKFRTMRSATDNHGNILSDTQRLKLIKTCGENSVSKDSMRMTKFGKFLRQSSLDELPELFNILKGEMSFVGPRPLAIIYLPYYTAEEMHRHDVLPGLTGLAQVNGRNAISWESRFKYDLKYIHNLSLKNDIFIILKTFMVILKHEGIVPGAAKLKAFNIERQQEWDSNGKICK